jgi:hydrogenase expression/formation protein HypD
MKKDKQIGIMEVCGTHTMAIARHGLRKILPADVRMLSGPGCPICVTETADIDRTILTAQDGRVILATFGDMLRVPGSFSTLENERSKGSDIRVVYSPADALAIAVDNPGREVVFAGVGFETTTPTVAATVLMAARRRVRNFSVLPFFKTVPNALRFILEQGHAIGAPGIKGFLLPGHVSAIIGSQPYEFIARDFGVPGVIAGFEPDDILAGVGMLRRLITTGKAAIENQYVRAVTRGGNPSARAIMSRVLTEVDSSWRSIGVIPRSGMTFAAAYAEFDATRRFIIKVPPSREPKGCQCGSILLGVKRPRQCALFGKACTPARPVGPCMVSSEGACAAEFKYGE